MQGEEYIKCLGKIEEKKVFTEIVSCCKKKCFSKIGVEKQNELYAVFWCEGYQASNVLLNSMMEQKKRAD